MAVFRMNDTAQGALPEPNAASEPAPTPPTMVDLRRDAEAIDARLGIGPGVQADVPDAADMIDEPEPQIDLVRTAQVIDDRLQPLRDEAERQMLAGLTKGTPR